MWGRWEAGPGLAPLGPLWASAGSSVNGNHTPCLPGRCEGQVRGWHLVGCTRLCGCKWLGVPTQGS